MTEVKLSVLFEVLFEQAETRILKPKTRNQKPEYRIPKQETRNQNHRPTDSNDGSGEVEVARLPQET